MSGAWDCSSWPECIARDYDDLNAAAPAVASSGYGLAAAALAEAANGVVASFDSAFELEYNGETDKEFLSMSAN